MTLFFIAVILVIIMMFVVDNKITRHRMHSKYYPLDKDVLRIHFSGKGCGIEHSFPLYITKAGCSNARLTDTCECGGQVFSDRLKERH